NMCWS
ncbi:AMP-binding enzyme family protein, partial [Vibrio parahaemolyticus V-223/04]